MCKVMGESTVLMNFELREKVFLKKDISSKEAAIRKAWGTKLNRPMNHSRLW